jgi:hypothetical protein
MPVRCVPFALAGLVAALALPPVAAAAPAAARCYPVPLGIAAARVPAGTYVSELLPTLVSAGGTASVVPVLCFRPATVRFDPTRAPAFGRTNALAIRWTVWRRGRAVGRARFSTCSNGCVARGTIRLRGARTYRSLLGRVRVYTSARARTTSGRRILGTPVFLPRPAAALADARLTTGDTTALAELVLATVPRGGVIAVSGQRSVIDAGRAWIRATRPDAPAVFGLVRRVAGVWTAPSGFGTARRCPAGVPADLVRLCAPVCPGPVVSTSLRRERPAASPAVGRARGDVEAIVCPLAAPKP